MNFFSEIKFDDKGLIAAIIQDIENNDVLMLGYMNEEAVRKTLKGPFVTFYSRSRNKLWVKGESSGHTQEVREIYYDCDGDALLIKVKQNVAACHEGYRTCFFRKIEGSGLKVVGKKLFDPRKKYK
ncbi:MAG: phosphoribosyl-AMP cyclohydrolase [bacterium]|nr:phosphoribosyl-AMP cyclohydrolase [bacterium]